MADAVGGAPKANGHVNGYPSSYAAKYKLAPHFIGGNDLSKAPPSKVKDFVAAHDGHTVITNVRILLLLTLEPILNSKLLRFSAHSAATRAYS